MNGKRNRRRVRTRKNWGKNSGMKIIAIIGIMLIAVFLGYLTAKFVIGPILGYNADESSIKIAEKDTAKENETEETSGNGTQSEGTAEEESSETAAVPDEGYALQFGVFSTKEAADEMVASLKAKGIETEVIETDNMYKVISSVIKTKDEALTKLDEVKNQAVEDVFIASF